ncbi:hypothetical protein SADUNF_Sadunf09G0014800 [Salix dunnii]|uniref:Lipoxygenase domain-containing protein n=1 Tax=Salix dunnii TaxID=1413687 RepID=A0A835JV98_9ROSI|nr:hypothetical protein SADUNF_Sadunf09G0014800 [Salix dunnii]
MEKGRESYIRGSMTTIHISSQLARPVLGGKEHPYPRRCRTRHPHTRKDPSSESKSLINYVPRDEVFSEVKQFTFSATTLQSVLNALLPSIESIQNLHSLTSMP